MRERIGGMGIKEGSVAYTLQCIFICAWEKKKGIQQRWGAKNWGRGRENILCLISMEHNYQMLYDALILV